MGWLPRLAPAKPHSDLGMEILPLNCYIHMKVSLKLVDLSSPGVSRVPYSLKPSLNEYWWWPEKDNHQKWPSFVS